MSDRDPLKNIRQLLVVKSSFTTTEVEEAVDEVLKMKYFVNENREMLIRRVEELYRIRQEDYRIIEKEERNLPWLNEKRSQINFENGFWGRYRDYLGDEKNFPPDTINKLDRLSDRILCYSYYLILILYRWSYNRFLYVYLPILINIVR